MKITVDNIIHKLNSQKSKGNAWNAWNPQRYPTSVVHKLIDQSTPVPW